MCDSKSSVSKTQNRCKIKRLLSLKDTNIMISLKDFKTIMKYNSQFLENQFLKTIIKSIQGAQLENIM